MRPEWGREIPGGWFNEESHLYRLQSGVIVPSTTQVFSILGLNSLDDVPKDMLEWKQGYGIACHAAVNLLAKNDLDWDSVDEQIVPAVTGIEEWLTKNKYEHEAGEEARVHCHNGMSYGMTSDLRGSIMFKEQRRKAIIDLKSGVRYSKTWLWQCGAYTLAHPGYMGIVLQFDKEGEVEPYFASADIVTAQREFQVLLAAAILKLNSGFAQIGGLNGNSH